MSILRVTASQARLEEENYKMLGTMPDDDLAKKLGTSFSSVSSARRRKGIPIFRE